MRLKKNKISLSIFVCLYLCVGLLFLTGRTSKAESVDFRAVKYGTHQTSMASGYFVRPARVLLKGRRYIVTMTIRTKHSLSPWPVKVISVNGHPPLSVSKTKNSTYYDYVYSFAASSLKGHINALMSINVLGVYKAKHNISFEFSQDQLPLPAKRQKENKGKSGQSSKRPKKRPFRAKNLPAIKRKRSKFRPNIATRHRLAANRASRIYNERAQRNYKRLLERGTAGLLLLFLACLSSLYLTVKRLKTKLS